MAICHCWHLSQALIKLLQVTFVGRYFTSLLQWKEWRFTNPKHIFEVPNQTMMGLVRTCHVGRIGESSCACGSHFHEYLRSRGCKHSGGHRHCSSQVLRSISSKVATARCQPSIRWLSAMALMVAEKLKMSGSNLSRMQYSSRCTRFKPSGKTAVQIHLNLLDDILDDYRYMKVNRLKVRLKTLTCLHKVGWTSAFCLASFFCSLLLSESTQSTHMSPSTFTVLPWIWLYPPYP